MGLSSASLTAVGGFIVALVGTIVGIRRTSADAGLIRVNSQGRIVDDQDKLIDNLKDEIARLTAARRDDQDRITALEEERARLREELDHAWRAIHECQDQLHSLPGRDRRRGSSPGAPKRRRDDGDEQR